MGDGSNMVRSIIILGPAALLLWLLLALASQAGL